MLVLGKNIYIGISTRSNEVSIRQIQELLNQYGYKVTGVEMHDCLHLKTAVTKVDEKTLLINPKWVDTVHFKDFDWIVVDSSEPFAAIPLLEGRSYSPLRSQRPRRNSNKSFKIVTVNA